MTRPVVRDEGSRPTVRAVDRALDVLLCLSGSAQSLGVTQIARRLGLYKSTVHRLLASLEARGFVRREAGSERYRLGVRALELAASYIQGDDVAAVAYAEMRRLRDEVGETVSLYVRDGSDRVRVQKAEGRDGVRRVVALGQRMPLYVGAAGKVLLAWAPADERADLLQPASLPPGFHLAVLTQGLAQAREQGWAMSIEERAEGAAAVAAPIFDRAGHCVAALAISGPAHRFDDQTIARYAASAVACAHSISLSL